MSNTPMTVHGGWDAFGVPDFSPACLKLKTYLRMTNTPYTATLGDPRKAPTKKIPYVTFGGEAIGDSNLIIDHLKKNVGDPLDGALTPEQHAIGHLVRRTCEESLYWAVLHVRWADDAAFEELAPQFKKIVPPVIGGLIVKMIRKETLRNAWGQGMSRHAMENVVAHGKADVDALSVMLGARAYLFGDSPTSYDASLYGSIANVMAFPAEGPLAAHAKSKANLVAFVERIKTTYWATPDPKREPS